MIRAPLIPSLHTIFFPHKTHSELAMIFQSQMIDTWTELTDGLDQGAVVRLMRRHKLWKTHEELTHYTIPKLQKHGSLAQYQWALEQLVRVYDKILIDSLI